MSTNSNEQERLNAELLSRYRLAPPSPELRDRVLRAAHDAWNTPDPAFADVSWRFPLFRLAASLVVTLILVHLASSAARCSIAPWQPACQTVASPRPLIAVWSNTEATPFAAFAAILAEKNQSQRLRDHIRHIQELLNTSEGCEMKRIGQSS